MSYLLLLGAFLLIAFCVFLWKRVRNRSRMAQAGAAIGLLALIVVAVGMALAFLFTHAMCGEYVFPAVEASDHSAIAQVTEFDCGATSPFTSIVRLRSTKSLAARLKWNRWHTVFAIEHDPRLISLKWTGPQELTIRHPIPYRGSVKCDSTWGDVKITCEPYKPDEKLRLPQLPEPNQWLW